MFLIHIKIKKDTGTLRPLPQNLAIFKFQISKFLLVKKKILH